MLAFMGAERAATDTPEDAPAMVLEFDGVSLAGAGGQPRLDRVSLSVPAASVTVVAGPSGAGKSTLLRLGNGLELPSAGIVRFRGTDISQMDPLVLRRRVGMIFQKPVPFAGSVQQNLYVAASKATDAELATVLERVGLGESFLERSADELSGGECQRMCLARALLTRPEVLLMDEPTSALDPENRFAIEGLARDLTREGLGVIWVSHDLDQARRVADQIVVLIDGRNANPMEAERYLGQSGTGVEQ